MIAALLLLPMTTVAFADEPFYPKATGQGNAISGTKDTARFAVSCVRRAPQPEKEPLTGGIKVIIKSPKGWTSTIDMPAVKDAVFMFAQCTMTGDGSLTLNYANGQSKKFVGSVRATITDRTSDRKPGQTADALSIAFWSPDLKVPQVNFQGTVNDGHIAVTHLPYPTALPPAGKKVKKGIGP